MQLQELLHFLVQAGLVFVMMRFGCGLAYGVITTAGRRKRPPVDAADATGLIPELIVMTQRVHALIDLLLVGIIAGLVGWINQVLP